MEQGQETVPDCAMFKTINDVPAPIREFYDEVVVQVPTGNYYTQFYYDKGVRKSREVEYIRPVSEVHLKPFGERRSWEDVVGVVAEGKPEPVIERFIEAATNDEAWQFHDEYIEWLELQPEPEFDEEGHQLPVDPVGVEPVRTHTDPQPYRVAAAKLRRDTGRYEPIEHNGMMFDADIESYANIVGTIDSWDTLLADPLMAQSGMVDGDKMYWTLQDNTNVLVDKATLQGVVDAIRVRAGKLHAEYQAIKMQETKPANAL